MHVTTGHWRLGLALSLGAAVMWGVLPIALKAMLIELDAYTVTWARFGLAALVLWVYLAASRRLPRLGRLAPRGGSLLVVAILGLAANYLLYVLGLDLVTPGTAQVVIQLAPMFLMLGALVVFGERFRPLQWLGVAALLVGLGLFFNERLAELGEVDNPYAIGVALVTLAAVAWAIYALAQKQLLLTHSSAQIMWMIYVAATVLLLPLSDLAPLLRLDLAAIGLLVFCSFNTLVAYGCFAEALAHWEASKVSAILAVVPLLTLAFMWLLWFPFPQLTSPEPINGLAIFGAFVVVAGSALTALGGTRGREGRAGKKGRGKTDIAGDDRTTPALPRHTQAKEIRYSRRAAVVKALGEFEGEAGESKHEGV